MGTQKFSLEELSGYDGLEGRPAYIACYGKVYDVTNSFLWQSGKHQVLHLAGNDLSNELLDAPHDMDLIERFPVVGVLIEKGKIGS
jgi:predicted heme/steroid binding protein